MPATAAQIPNAQTLHIYDIVEEWRKLTNLPAVLAVWTANREAATPELVADFQSSLAYGLDHLDGISREAAADLALL